MLGGGTPSPFIVRRKGIYVENIKGKRYIGCTSISWALYLGFNYLEINWV